MHEQIRDVDPKEFLIKKIKENSKTFGKSVIRAVLFREKNETYFYYGKVIFLHKSQKASNNFTHDYGRVILINWEINIDELLKFIESFSNESIILNEIKDIKIKGGFDRDCYHLSSRNRWAGVMNEWPFWFIRYSCDSNFGINFMNAHDSLVISGLDPYPDFYEATEKFLELGDRPNVNTPIGLQFLVPDYRSRIKKLEIAEKHVSIEIETKETTIDNLLLQFYCSKNNSYYNSKEVKITENSIAEITIPFAPEVGHVYLLERKSGKEIDSKSFGRWYTERNDGVIVKTPKETIESMISKGEYETIEFKMDIGKTDEFLESIVAFANTKGGTILLGIHDDGRVVGIEDDYEKIEKKIRNLIANRCEPDIDVKIEPFMFDKRQIISLSVKEGDNKPYLLIGKSAYKRVIKDDYPMSRHDLDGIYSKKKQNPEYSEFA